MNKNLANLLKKFQGKDISPINRGTQWRELDICKIDSEGRER
jgi:hypothetical protein